MVVAQNTTKKIQEVKRVLTKLRGLSGRLCFIILQSNLFQVIVKIWIWDVVDRGETTKEAMGALWVIKILLTLGPEGPFGPFGPESPDGPCVARNDISDRHCTCYCALHACAS